MKNARAGAGSAQLISSAKRTNAEEPIDREEFLGAVAKILEV
jgi:hypothetical protein